jgi:hypothetical protein
MSDLWKDGWGRNRTADTRIFSPLLCQLSYPAESRWRYCNAMGGGCSLKQKTLNAQRRVVGQAFLLRWDFEERRSQDCRRRFENRRSLIARLAETWLQKTPFQIYGVLK